MISQMPAAPKLAVHMYVIVHKELRLDVLHSVACLRAGNSWPRLLDQAINSAALPQLTRVVPVQGAAAENNLDLAPELFRLIVKYDELLREQVRLQTTQLK